MAQGEEVVIRDDAGVEHVFPAGFDPKRAASIVRGQSQPFVGPVQPTAEQNRRSSLPIFDIGAPAALMGMRSDPGETATAFLNAINPLEMVRGALRTAKGAYQAIRHPIDTAQGIPAALNQAAESIAQHPGAAMGSAMGMAALPSMLRAGGGALKAAAPRAYELGMSRTPTMRREFPNAAARGVQEGVLPTPEGVQKVLTTAERGTLAPIRAYDKANPANIDPLVLGGQANASAITKGRLAGRAIQQPAMDELSDLNQQFMGENQAPMSAERALQLKRAEQLQAHGAYRAAEKGRPVGDVEQLWHQGMGDAAKRQLVQRVPEAEDALTREQDLIGLLRGAEYSENGPSALRHMVSAMSGTGLFASGHPVTALAAMLLNEGVKQPKVMGSLGIGLDRTGRVLQNPNALRAALLAQMAGVTSPDGQRGP